MGFTIRIVQPPGDIHWQGLYETAAGIEYSLRQLGHDCILDLERKLDINARRLIIFNAQRLPEDAKIPYDAIIFNAEQIGSCGNWPIYLKHLQQHIVWDYSKVNIERLHQHGVSRTVHCPLGYWPGLSNILPTEEDIDVLFIGSMNARREQLIQDIASKGLKVQSLFGIYGEDRNKWIARSKTVLNAHFYPNPIWEVFRVSYLLANKKCVVTEDSGVDENLEYLARTACSYVPYDKIAETCVSRSQGNWKEVGQNGFSVFSKQDQVDFVKKALTQS
jgi:hypothetical protein